MQAESSPARVYMCPRTREMLSDQGQQLRSETGATAYPLKEGIPRFQHADPLGEDAGDERLRRLVEVARSIGWDAALREVFRDQPAMLRYVTRPDRASMLDLLPLTPQSEVLEIGPGFGQFTADLARRAKAVWALEVVPDQAEFVALRCRQQGLANVEVAVGGDDCRLPYADASFDVVVLNLVLEWCAMRCTDEPMVDAQRRLLGEIVRVLKPGGALYLSTKNRFALKYLLGRPDEHAHGMRFGSALPRSWMMRALRRRGHARPSGFLHSHGALERMLHDAGFAQTRSFWAAPEMRYPTHYVATDAESVRQARRQPGFVQGEGRSGRWLMRWVPAAWVKYVTPGLAFLATRPRPGP